MDGINIMVLAPDTMSHITAEDVDKTSAFTDLLYRKQYVGASHCAHVLNLSACSLCLACVRLFLDVCVYVWVRALTPSPLLQLYSTGHCIAGVTQFIQGDYNKWSGHDVAWRACPLVDREHYDTGHGLNLPTEA